MRYQVPQFIETETKIVGPLTLKQLLYLGAAFVLIIIFSYMFPFSTTIILGIPVALVAVALAYLKIDGIPLPKYALMGIYFLVSRKDYVFKHEDQENPLLK